MDDKYVRIEALKLSYSIAEKLGIFTKHNWDNMSLKERREAFDNITSTAEEFCKFVLKEK